MFTHINNGGGFIMPLELDGRTYYNISEACELAGISRDTFLRWVRKGKFTDVEHRDRNGWRLFTNDDVRRLTARINLVEKININPGRSI
jgi:excisionase family DNA binding protein